jgi:hypothetical protein
MAAMDGGRAGAPMVNTPGAGPLLSRAGLLASLWIVALMLLVPRPAAATPQYAIGSAHACNTCHVEPTGWLNPEKKDRRCTLDCQGCHVSPTGGGLRTPLGEYYGREVLPMFGKRPSEAADMMRFARPGEPISGGGYTLQGGWNDGWWPGDVQHREIPDRYGDIDPAPVWQVGGDFRIMHVQTNDGTRTSSATFPMEAQVYGAWHPASNLTAYLDLGVQGKQTPPPGQSTWDGIKERAWIREAFVMIHDLPGSQYVRAGRFFLPFGWRIPDHTAYTRRDTGFDVDRQAYGVEWGQAYSEWWSNVAVWHQGLDAWPGESAGTIEGNGLTAQGGWRGMGYQLGGSLHAMSQKGGGSEFVVGPMWAANLFPVVYLGEAYLKRSASDGKSDTVSQLATFHELQWQGFTGLTPKVRYEWIDKDIDLESGAQQRLLAGFEFNPYRNISLDIVFRRTMDSRADVGSKNQWLLQTHVWF